MALIFDNVNQVSPGNQNFADQRLVPATPSGFSTANALVGNFLGRGRSGVWRRQIMTWTLPNRLESVQMYINPQNFVIDKSKQITEIRTRGGFISQYWGENLDKARISGTTGSGGIEGINILRDVYRTEHANFEGVAQGLLQRVKSGNFNDFVSGDIFRNVKNIGNMFRQSQTDPGAFQRFLGGNNTVANLADVAFNVKLNFQGVVYRGYFTAFQVTEIADSPGIFTYSMDFTILETQGKRDNFMPWHRAPHSGPADSAIVPLSYSTIIGGASTRTRAISEMLAGTISSLAGVQGVPGARQGLLEGTPSTPPPVTGDVANTSVFGVSSGAGSRTATPNQ